MKVEELPKDLVDRLRLLPYANISIVGSAAIPNMSLHRVNDIDVLVLCSVNTTKLTIEECLAPFEWTDKSIDSSYKDVSYRYTMQLRGTPYDLIILTDKEVYHKWIIAKNVAALVNLRYKEQRKAVYKEIISGNGNELEQFL